jgi:hypothetical protein
MKQAMDAGAFKVGDKVKFIARGWEETGRVGVIKRIEKYAPEYVVELVSGGEIRCNSFEIRKV